ncbi:MAG TPA: type II secretion system protein [Thermoanaerobaculia bacterium]|nr:type II secretion system protein [Thermoanaerobaculia bacterium]
MPANRQSGFTLAGVLVIMTVIAVFVAYTVPRQWSIAMKRDREKQTIFIMKQYARSISAWQTAHGGLPTALDQLKEARSPRLVRGPKAEWVDPMTGKVDWILVPPQVAAQGVAPSSSSQWGNAYPNLARPGGVTGASGSTGTTGATDTTGTAPATKSSPKDYKGPFVGVRPNITGQSYMMVNGADQYENWLYTINDLKNETDAFQRGLAMMAQWK